ncbi:hypothetical protein PAXRUDRAFT_12309 [Paxillus rubicundulus Ve08.2h10]|uniref:Uncharacterized protein n=1 Tax=Paxillus rubicundulus Ve08.2h10 TaxID=930991 RepID=A0A0D0E1B9_9AGAM|nr:hypothetical protein PAXRUDRAFT_12309 [Paxillus rubicundulus Ve08.2h10]
MSSASSRAVFSSTSDSPGTSQNASSKCSKTLVPPSRDTIHNLLNKGMAAIKDDKARLSNVKLKSLRLKKALIPTAATANPCKLLPPTSFTSDRALWSVRLFTDPRAHVLQSCPSRQ